MTLGQDGLPERPVGLVIQRPVGGEPADSSSMSHAPVSPPWRTFVWGSGLRWAIEPCCAEGKTERGMDHDAVRKDPGWHHHRLTTMLAHCFLWHRKLRLGKKRAGSSRIAAPDVLGRRLTPTDVSHCRGPGARRVGAAASSPGLSSASSTAARGRRELWTGVCSEANNFWSRKYILRLQFSPVKVLSPEHPAVSPSRIAPDGAAIPQGGRGRRFHDDRKASAVSQDGEVTTTSSTGVSRAAIIHPFL